MTSRFHTRQPLVAFFVLAYLLSWGWWLPLAFAGDTIARGRGWPTHVPGLLGPLLAAGIVLAATEGRAGMRRWIAAMVRVPRSWRWRAAALAPLGFGALGLIAVVVRDGGAPPGRDFMTFSGTDASLGPFILVLLAGAVAEESGWRGYALPRLQARYEPLRATLILTCLWAGWHAPLFAVLDSYGGFSTFTLLGFVVGLGCGATVLTALYNHSGGSILAVAAWHASYNAVSATGGADGTIAAVSTAAVIFWAVSLIQRQRAGQDALGRPTRPRSADWTRQPRAAA